MDIAWGPVGYVTYKRTYARRLNENDPNSATEEFEDTIERVLKACHTQLKCGFTPDEENRLRYYFKKMKGSVAGRFWWQLGSKTVDKLGLASLQNCAVTVVDEPIRPFTWAMDMLMLGCGVGYNIGREYVYQLPRPMHITATRQDTKDADFIVPDSREGWVELLRKVLEAHFVTGKSFTYSTMLIRGKGALIRGFGGVASGPEELCWGMLEINKILNSRASKKVRPIDALDIMNVIGFIVVAGNVRRSAEIAGGDFDDMQYLNAKKWSLGNIPNHRSMSNNSVICNDINLLPDQFWQGYDGSGEPYGLINLKLSQSCGRVGDTRYTDPNIVMYNPCQPDFATVLTPEGVKQFKDISIGSKIWSKEGWTTVVNKWSTGVKSVSKFKTSGGVFIGTDNHRVDTKEGKVEVSEAEEILTIGGPLASRVDFNPQVIMDGLYLGDGYLKTMIGRDDTYPTLIVGESDKDYFDSEINKLFISKLQNRNATEDWRVRTTITQDEKKRTFDLEIPERYYLKDTTTTLSLLRGLHTANGSVVKQKGNSVRITYKTTSKVLSEQIQLMLSSVGIRSYITTNKEKENKFENGTYICKESYDINITKDYPIFYKLIGFIQKYKMDKIATVIDSYSPMNTETYTSKQEVEYLGEFEVFDITVDNHSHTYWTGGLSVSNCAEQSLEKWETCALAEFFLPNIASIEEFKDVAELIYRIVKHSLALPCHNKETEEIVHKNMRMGLGITGYLQASEEQKQWLPEVYEHLRAYDVEYSKKHGFNVSIKLTTCKPSGTLSKLPGVTSGVHPGWSKYYIQRIRMASNSPLVETCRKHGYQVEYQRNFDGSEDYNTVVVSFPCSFPEGTICAKDVTAIQQLEYVCRLQRDWSDNAVSCTVYYNDEELPEIKEWLKVNYNNSLKTVSFLRHSNHGFDQAPWEEITEEQFLEMSKNVRIIENVTMGEEEIQSSDCDKGMCPIR